MKESFEFSFNVCKSADDIKHTNKTLKEIMTFAKNEKYMRLVLFYYVPGFSDYYQNQDILVKKNFEIEMNKLLYIILIENGKILEVQRKFVSLVLKFTSNILFE